MLCERTYSGSRGVTAVMNQTDFDDKYNRVMRAEAMLAKGHEIEHVLESCELTMEQMFDAFQLLAMPPTAGEMLSESQFYKAISPVFAETGSGSTIEQIATCVLVNINDELFALTAAHVMDSQERGNSLYIPTADGIEPLTGSWSMNKVLEGTHRESDTWDVGYFRLSEGWKSKLDPHCIPLDLCDLSIDVPHQPGQVFTFIGYPYRKANKCGVVHESEKYTYSGHACGGDVYAKLKYSVNDNILMRMRRKKTYSTRYDSFQTAPHPQGMSGGAVVVWPSAYADRQDPSNLRLAGICTGYHANHHCMAATKTGLFLDAIMYNNPRIVSSLAANAVGTRDPVSSVAAVFNHYNPSVVAIPWYTLTAYKSCLGIFFDREDLPSTFEKWNERALGVERELRSKGSNVLRVYIEPDSFVAWCIDHKIDRYDRDARMKYANSKAFEHAKANQ